MFRVEMLPAADGDCFFVETAGASGSHRILIDGGRQATARQYLRPFLNQLPARQGMPTVDLIVLTHVDADHIEGLLELLDAQDAPTVGEVWFNELRHLKLAKGLQPVQAPTAGRTPVLSTRQGVSFAKLISDRGCRWNFAFNNGPVMVKDKGELPHILLGSGAALTLLGPPQANLAAFLADWPDEILKFGKPPTGVLAKRPLPVPTVDNVPAIARELDAADDKRPNGTSIAFILVHENRRVLFGADAQPDGLARALRQFCPDGEQIHFDAIKAPHHGSAGNNTSELVNLLQSPLWLISSDGSRHRHPDPEAIAKIVLGQPRPKKLMFNYCTRFNQVWEARALRARFDYEVDFGRNGQSSVIELS